MIHTPLSQYDLLDLVERFEIPYFKGIFMRDDLPDYLWKEECGIMNLDILKGKGTHWTSWYKKGDICFYFDSFGLPASNEFHVYMKCDVYHSTYHIQDVRDVICGHLSILILFLQTVCRASFNDALLYIINGSKYIR